MSTAIYPLSFRVRCRVATIIIPIFIPIDKGSAAWLEKRN